MRTPKDFREQIEEFCPKCGFAAQLEKRKSIEHIDDISPGNYERLKNTSPKIKQGEYKISNLKMVNCDKPLARYKDFGYRDRIANRYGMFLLINEYQFWTPYLRKEFKV